MTESFGFFEENELLTARKPLALVPACGKCGLYRTCNSPKMPVAGQGRKKILIVGEAPGATEDREGRPFIGDAGQRLQKELRKNDISLFGDCWIMNAAACRPPKNELPPKAVEHCRPLVMRAIEEHKPRTILLLGQHAIKSVISQLWKEDPGGPSQWSGFRIPCVKWNAWVCPTYHPSYVMRNEADGKDPVTSLLFARDVKRAVSFSKRPWPDGPPDYDKHLRLFTDSTEAVDYLNNFGQDLAANSTPMAFDFETTTLKPDRSDADIVCCSVSDGVDSMAFPWQGKVVETMKAILTDPNIKKVGANDKFEHRWCLKKLGIRVRGWVWDILLAQHAIDGRPKISNVKFQTLVRLGVEDYSASISPFLSGAGGNGPNKIRKVNMRDLLSYCAKDSLFEAIIAKQQRKELGYEGNR